MQHEGVGNYNHQSPGLLGIPSPGGLTEEANRPNRGPEAGVLAEEGHGWVRVERRVRLRRKHDIRSVAITLVKYGSGIEYPCEQ